MIYTYNSLRIIYDYINYGKNIIYIKITKGFNENKQNNRKAWEANNGMSNILN